MKIVFCNFQTRFQYQKSYIRKVIIIMSESYKNARNPILPLSHHVPDCEAHVFSDGKLYIYGSYDDYSDVYCSDKYHVISTEDMENWTISGISFEGSMVPWFKNPDYPSYPGIDWSKPTPFLKKMLMEMDQSENKERLDKMQEESSVPFLYAPDCMEKDGKYYLYFCMSDDSEGVAVSDSPEGPFKDPVQLPCGGIDPAVFVDDDGQAYYYWGQLFSHGVKLNTDMVSFDPQQAVHDLVTEQEHYFHEGSSLRKYKGLYYYVYADIEHGKPTSLGYSIGKSPLGPFEYKGVIIDNQYCDPESWNNHGSIECVHGKWYVFYHRCSRKTQQYRRLCIEPIEILEDGTIPEVVMTSQGPGAPFSPGETIYGYQACEVHGGCYIDDDGNGSECLTSFSSGCRAIFRYVAFKNPVKNIKIKASGSGRIGVYFDNDKAGTIEIENGIQQNREIMAAPGCYELSIECEVSDCLSLETITLEE